MRHGLCTFVAVMLAVAVPAWADDPEDDVADGDVAEDGSEDGGEDVAEDGDDAPLLLQYGRGPLEVRDPYLLALARTSPWARSPEILGHLQLEAGLRTLWANSYAFRGRGRIIVDSETREFTLSLRLGLFDRIELGLLLPYQWRGGGVMDRFITNFHRVFALPGANRDKRPQDRYVSSSTDPRGTTTTLEHKGYGLGDAHVSLRSKLTEGNELVPATAVTLRLRLPTGRPKFEFSDGVDATLQLDASKRLGSSPFIVYGSLAYTYYADANVDSLELERTRWFFSLGLEWEIKPWVSVIAHVWIESRRERQLWDDTGNPLTEPELTSGNHVSYIAVGFKFEPTEGLSLEVGVLENILDPDVTADLGFMLNAFYRF